MPDGAFALYMAGQYNKRTAKKATATTGACHGYLQLNKMVSLLPGNVLCDETPAWQSCQCTSYCFYILEGLHFFPLCGSLWLTDAMDFKHVLVECSVAALAATRGLMSCIAFAQNHFGINDFYPNTHQVRHPKCTFT